MANPEHVAKLKEGVKEWNRWREENPDIRFPDLSEADLSSANLSEADVSGADLIRADLSRAKLVEANLGGADLSGANLSGANISGARFFYTSFSDVDLSTAKGLEHARHFGPSTVGIDTLYESNGKIHPEFLRGCGVPDIFIDFIPSLVGDLQPVQFYSCFISYSHKDEEFVKRLHSRLQEEHLRVWFAPEDLKAGRKIHEEIDQAIRIYDRLLIVLSEASMASEWVKTEIANARQKEIDTGKRVLFPIRLVDFEAIKRWKAFDADRGKDTAREIREYYIPDFSNWKDHDSFETEFQKLLDALKMDEKIAEPERE